MFYINQWKEHFFAYVIIEDMYDFVSLKMGINGLRWVSVEIVSGILSISSTMNRGYTRTVLISAPQHDPNLFNPHP